MKENRNVLLRGLVGGILAVTALFLFCLTIAGINLWGGTASLGEALSRMSLSTHDARAFFGSELGGDLYQVLSVFALGCALGVATAPFAPEGRQLVVNSLLHFGVTGLLTVGAFAFLDIPWLTILSIYTLIYGAIWLGRWVGWYGQVIQLRAMLGLAEKSTPLKWAETLLYFPYIVLICTVLPVGLNWFDRTVLVDVPALSGLVYPYLVLPLVCFVVGLSMGKRLGFCPLFPLLCMVCYLPLVFLLFNSSALFHCWMAGAPALAGNLAGAAIGRRKKKGK